LVDVDGVRDRLDASTWAGIGLLGLLVFVIGVGFPYLPGSKSIPYHAWLPVVVAIGGGCLAALGLGFAYDLREGTDRPRKPAPPQEGGDGSVAGVPSFEIYRPGDAPSSPDRRS
jgi:hypothetical protein